jgi:hypothetical protein
MGTPVPEPEKGRRRLSPPRAGFAGAAKITRLGGGGQPGGSREGGGGYWRSSSHILWAWEGWIQRLLSRVQERGGGTYGMSARARTCRAAAMSLTSNVTPTIDRWWDRRTREVTNTSSPSPGRATPFVCGSNGAQPTSSVRAPLTQAGRPQKSWTPRCTTCGRGAAASAELAGGPGSQRVDMTRRLQHGARAIAGQGGNRIEQVVGIDGFDQMFVKAGGASALEVGGLSHAGEGNQFHG